MFEGVDEMSCPKCGSEMKSRNREDVTVSQCTSCGGIFLDRSDLGVLVEAENDWHRNSGPHTEPLPRITADMTSPPPQARPRARSYVETLFD
jgi:Zn-finger nucleic acid-binding protein